MNLLTFFIFIEYPHLRATIEFRLNVFEFQVYFCSRYFFQFTLSSHSWFSCIYFQNSWHLQNTGDRVVFVPYRAWLTSGSCWGFCRICLLKQIWFCLCRASIGSLRFWWQWGSIGRLSWRSWFACSINRVSWSLWCLWRSFKVVIVCLVWRISRFGWWFVVRNVFP